MLNENENYETYNLECSPSYLINNLTSTKKSLYFIHNSESLPRVLVVNKEIIFDKNKPKKNCISIFNSNETNEMLFIKTITLKDSEYIAIGLYNGFKLWNQDGSRLLFQISGPKINKNKIYAFICCCEFKMNQNDENFADSLLACDNYGQIFIIYGSKSNLHSKKDIYSTKNAESILSICSNIYNNHIGISLDNGDVVILKLENENCEMKKIIESQNGQNIAISSVMFSIKNKKEFFIAFGYIIGEIKIISINDYNIKFTINSNLRSVGPMIVINENEIVTGSDDGQLTIWKYDEDKNKIVLKKNMVFEDKMIVGLAYNEENQKLFVNCFDCPDIIIVHDI